MGNISQPGGNSSGSSVRITTTGSTFNPTVELASGSTATVSWTCEETGAVATGINPTINFGSSATRHVRMTAADAFGDAIKDIVTFNLGYDHTQDQGNYVMGAQYDKTAQAVSKIENVRCMTGLLRFAAANISTLVGTLDFSGLGQLQYIECYASSLTGVVLSGCTSLIRLVVELNNLTVLNLNPVPQIYDLRAAAQQGGALTILMPAGMENDYHFCVRGQNVTFVRQHWEQQLFVVQQLWAWSAGLSGSLTIVSTALGSLLLSGNSITSVDLTNAIPNGNNATVNLNQNKLSSLTLTGCSGLNTLDVSMNPLQQSAIDAILAALDGLGASNGTLILTQTWGVRSAAGVTSRGNLVGKGWSVSYDGPGVTSDNFTRANATGVANIGNDWYAWNGADANIVSNQLVRVDSGAYRQLLNHGGGALAADYSVSFIIPAGTVLSNCGFTMRWDGSNGVRLWFNSATSITIGDASGFNTNNVTISTPTFPASWSNSGISRTLKMHASGTTITIEIDAQAVVTTATVTTNATKTGTSFGFCGQGQNFVYGTVTTTTP